MFLLLGFWCQNMWNFYGLSPALNIGNRITSFEIKIGNKIEKQQKNLKNLFVSMHS